MRNIDDLEREKFALQDGKVIVRTESVSYFDEVGADFVGDLENLKFNSNGEVRVAITF